MLLLLVVVVVLSLIAIVQGQPDNMFNNMMNKNCPNFKCSSEYTPVPKSRTKFESTGCSAIGGGSMVMTAPGGGSNEKPYESCCHQWHACYQICGVSKRTCDTTFETCAKKSCDGKEEEDKEQCNKDIELSTMMMKISGCQRFDESQYHVCECTPTDKAADKKEQAIRNFYKKQSPENVDKAKSLVAKADTPSKLAGLFMKLLLKYPNAITIKEDPMQAMFDKIKTDDDEGEKKKKSTIVDEDDDENNNNGDDEEESEEEDKIEL